MRRTIATALLAATLALAACGSDDSDDDSTDAGGATTETTEADAAAGAGAVGAAAADLIGTADTDLGEVLTDAEGYTLYGFTEDEGGEPTCTDACADAWPPVLVEGGELPEGLDPATYSVVERPDGTFQLAAGDWPLYSYASDAAEGDVNGQGLGGSWYAMGADGQLVRDAAGGSATTEAPAADDPY